jgi:hypothetical protein
MRLFGEEIVCAGVAQSPAWMGRPNEASLERTAVITILWPAHRFWYEWKM